MVGARDLPAGYPGSLNQSQNLSGAGLSSRPTSKGGGIQKTPKPPAPTRPLFLKFHDVTEEELLHIAAAGSKSEVRQLLKDCMRIDKSEGFRKEILADMYFHNYDFCQSLNFTLEKTSTFLSISKLVLEEACTLRLTMESAAEVFKQWLLKHAVERPPHSIGVFTFEDVRAVTEYFHNTFFRHYRLYMYVYTTHCNLHVHVDEDEVAPLPCAPRRLWAQQAVDPKVQVELQDMPEFQISLAEQLRLERGDGPEDRAAIIKRKVDEGVQRLMQGFEVKLKAQDEEFSSRLEEARGK